ncbi:MAG: nicotinate (nicotinamide) nucleotide adenylyltransferase [Thermotogaceae bacterium]|nr:nicotinate (nicotinamide) nucleotide adenylyltransferase [Thermotogaceae bacterium]
MKIGIYGGAFNPVHNGHVIIAIKILEELKLDKLIMVPTYKPPHRSTKDLALYEYRKKWVDVAFDGIEKVCISDLEKEKGGISYSIETVKFFSEKYGVKPFFIIGEDSAVNFDKWYKYRDLKKLATFVVYPRYKDSLIPQIKSKYPEFVIMEKFPLIEISSTEIRNRIKENKSIRGMVDRKIEDEIIEVYRKIMQQREWLNGSKNK